MKFGSHETVCNSGVFISIFISRFQQVIGLTCRNTLCKNKVNICTGVKITTSIVLILHIYILNEKKTVVCSYLDKKRRQLSDRALQTRLKDGSVGSGQICQDLFGSNHPIFLVTDLLCNTVVRKCAHIHE